MSMMVEPFTPLQREFNRLFGPGAGPAPFLPPADLLVAEDGITVYLDVPGVRSENLEIELENDLLSIRGERPMPYTEDPGTVRRIERPFGRFERSMRVPPGCDAGDVDASLQDGVLRVHVPRPASQQPRRIDVRAGGGAQDIQGSQVQGSQQQGAQQQGSEQQQGTQQQGSEQQQGTQQQGSEQQQGTQQQGSQQQQSSQPAGT
jgi:HSP20 family protein